MSIDIEEFANFIVRRSDAEVLEHQVLGSPEWMMNAVLTLMVLLNEYITILGRADAMMKTDGDVSDVQTLIGFSIALERALLSYVVNHSDHPDYNDAWTEMWNEPYV